MMWNSEQPVDTMEDDGDDSMQDIGAAEHMPASASLRECDGDGESEGGELDIAAELKRIAADALAVIKEVIQSAGVLQVILAPFEQTLIDLEQTPADVLARPTVDDDFEVRLAQALFQVDELLPGLQPPLPVLAVRGLRAMQVHAQDLAILACSRLIKQAILRNKGFPSELLIRLHAAFTVTALADEFLKSRLGNAKYHVWTVGKHFGERKHRHGRGGRGSRRNLNGSVGDEGLLTVMTVSASAAPAASSPAEISRPPEVASSSALTCAPGETSADAAWSGLNKSCLGNHVLEDTFNRYEGNGTCSTSGLDKQSVGSGGQRSEDEDGGCFRAPEALIVEEDSNILETFAAEPIVDTTDKSDSEELELMLVEVLAKHGVYTSDLKSDIMRWQQRQMFMYPMTFSF